MPALPAESKIYLWRTLVVATLYGVLGVACLELLPSVGMVRILWPATATALALLTIWGVELLPAVVLGAFVVPLAAGAAPPLALALALANAAEVGLGAYLLRNIFVVDPLLHRLQDMLSLMTTATLASFASASVLIFLGSIFDAAPISSVNWSAWWISHTVGSLVLLPLLLRWIAYPHFSSQPATAGSVLEKAVGFGTLIGILALSLSGWGAVGNVPLLYLLLLPLIWAALRTGPGGITLALTITAATAIINSMYGPASTNASEQSLLNLQIFAGALAVIFLPFAALVEERKDVVHRLSDNVERLEHALEKIRAEDQAKSEFLAILAHELRNPLSPILSGLELLKSDARAPADVVHMMGAHTHAIARLLDDLLDFSRISQKKFKLQKEPVKLQAVIDQTLEMVRPYITGQRHTLDIDLPRQDIWLNADPVRLTQIFSNILNNSAKYTDPGGKLSLAARREAGTVVVRIKDNGIGIAPERIGRIFEPFSPGTPARKPGGLRIGLSLSKRMAELHHGSIEARSDGEGKGSEFIVRLPADGPTQAPLPLRETLGKRVRARFSRRGLREHTNAARHLLLVDDNEAAAQSLAALLQNNGHRVELAYDAPEAIQKAASGPFEAVILDIGLPSMDGYELARRIRPSQPGVPFIALTGYGQDEDKERAKEAGFSHHLVKPVSIVDLERTLAQLCKIS